MVMEKNPTGIVTTTSENSFLYIMVKIVLLFFKKNAPIDPEPQVFTQFSLKFYPVGYNTIYYILYFFNHQEI